MNNNSQIWNFLTEMVKRLGAKSPKFFQVLGYLLLGTTLLTGLPAFLQEVGVTLPEVAVAVMNKVIAISTAVGFFITKLTVVTPPVDASTGQRESTATTLPFTTVAEAKAEAKDAETK